MPIPTFSLKMATIRHATDGVPWCTVKPGVYTGLPDAVARYGLRTAMNFHQPTTLRAWRSREKTTTALTLMLSSVILPDATYEPTPPDREGTAALLKNLQPHVNSEMNKHIDGLISDLEDFTPTLERPDFNGYMLILSSLAVYTRLRAEQVIQQPTGWEQQPGLLRRELSLYLDPTRHHNLFQRITKEPRIP